MTFDLLKLPGWISTVGIASANQPLSPRLKKCMFGSVIFEMDVEITTQTAASNKNR